MTVEALHLANLLGAYGYIFPIDDHILTVKNDGAYYRFQVNFERLSITYLPSVADSNRRTFSESFFTGMNFARIH